ncbi:MAG: MazG-like family protein [Syntrophomonadaceae bacterium]|mgnify:CR=1 FL=1|nr:MazG-like family protein [Syntrophomonadaceae bacterium]MDD3888667.1 MazG-like family protein [Syntrophomonadaceae bacterium]MDD4548517.1 MazG-like family protein [Syntrophomonadaceae bacterium]
MAKSRVKELDITRNLKVVEWLKAELVDSVGVLFKAFLKTGNEAKSDALATIIIIAYLIGHKTGLSFSHIDKKILNKLDTSIDASCEEEQWYADLADLLNYLEHKKR